MRSFFRQWYVTGAVCVITQMGTSAAAMDTMSCLQAKSKFEACAGLSKSEDFPLRSCLAADSGYIDCRKHEGPGSHERCLPAKGQYDFCRQPAGGALTHNECLLADSGFKDCITWTHQPMLCLNVKGGYDACRRGPSRLPHQSCVAADSGFADCTAHGGSPNFCLAARRSYKYCRTVDHFSHLFCTKIGKGYAECRMAGYSLGHCMNADHGFGDCVKYRD